MKSEGVVVALIFIFYHLYASINCINGSLEAIIDTIYTEVRVLKQKNFLLYSNPLIIIYSKSQKHQWRQYPLN